MNKYKKLVSNSVVFAIGNFGSKFITFIMLPVYTIFMTTTDYGTADLIQTTSNLLLPLVSLNIFEGVMRYAMDDGTDSSAVLNVGMKFTTIGSMIVGLIAVIAGILGHLNVAFLCLLIVMQAFQSLFTQFLKAIEKIRLFAINGILLTVITAALNIVFLVVFHLGIIGYMTSLILATAISNGYLFILGGIFERFSGTMRNDESKQLSSEMIAYSLPLIPNSIAWWATSTISRYFIVVILGAAANGVFAVANKIPSLLSVVNSIFFQSWQISAIDEFDKPDSGKFFSTVFQKYEQFLFLGSSGILLFLSVIFKFVVGRNFQGAILYVPMLLLSVIYSSFASFFGQYYVASKKTFKVFTTTVYGAVLNVILNLILVPAIGLMGAAIGSVVSYLLVWGLRVKDTRSIVQTRLPILNLCFNHAIIFLQMLMYMISGLNLKLSFSVQVVLMIASCFINANVLKDILQILKKRKLGF